MASPKPPLKVVALISGGKDSFFSLQHCLAQGHRVLALANLHPPGSAAELVSEALGLQPESLTHTPIQTPPPQPTDQDDIESHMYQTAGHSVVPLYAKVLPFPVYRGTITGSAVDTGREYTNPGISALALGNNATTQAEGSTTTKADPIVDETESLFVLLQKIKRLHPEIDAVCSGAILSTYQRTRVEDVCGRLALISLAWLWQWPSLPSLSQSSIGLLEDIAAAGLDARIVKVASGGLDDRFLWASLADSETREKLRKAVSRFGGSPLGEGGEFETLVVAGPRGLWRGRIEVAEDQKEVVMAEAGEALLRIKSAEVIIDEAETRDQDWREDIRVPELLDVPFKVVLEKLQGTEWTHSRSSDGEKYHSTPDSWTINPVVFKTATNLYLSNLTCAHGDVAEQTGSICITLESLLQANSLSPDATVFTTILLRSMADFATVNAIYSKLFTRPLPPARVTIAVGDSLPANVHVSLSAVATFTPRSKRSGLHVQSRSYWAPANIGPYSQAICIPWGNEEKPKLAFIAGQIPLVPATMEVHGGAFLQQAVLSAQHLWRIGMVVGVKGWTGAVAFLAGGNDCSMKAMQCAEIWKLMHVKPDEEEDDTDSDAEFDVWHQKHGGVGGFSDEREEKKSLPDFETLAQGSRSDVCPGFFAVQVQELPRGSSVEWQSLGLDGEGLMLDTRTPGVRSCGIASGNERQACLRFYEIGLGEGHVFMSKILKQHGLLADTETNTQRSHATIYTPRSDSLPLTQAMVVPCKRVWGHDGTEIEAGLVIYEE